MTRNIHEPSDSGAINVNRFGIKQARTRPLAFAWWEPGDLPGTTLQNSWAQASAPLETFAFRLHSDGSLEFKGHLDSSGASSGTVAVTLPGANTGDIEFRPAHDQFFVSAIYDGATPQSALVYLDATTGDVTITFPL